MTEINEPVVLYDGKCNFCNAVVNFIIARDRQQRFKFAPLQSKEARKILRERNEAFASLKTVYFVKGEHLSKRSHAIFDVFKHLGKPYSILAWFRILPLFITDSIYKLIAKNRYKWFGEASDVIVPDEKIKGRFIDGVFKNAVKKDQLSE